MTIKYGRRKISRTRRYAPRRIKSFKKLNQQIGRPFSAVLNSQVLKKPVNKLIKSIRMSLGGKLKKKKTQRKRYK